MKEEDRGTGDSNLRPADLSAPTERIDSGTREFVSVDELAVELGLNRKTLYNAINLQQIPGIRRLGNRILVHRPTVVEWVRSGRGAVPRSRSRS